MTITLCYDPTKADLLRSVYVALRSKPRNFAAGVGLFFVAPWLCALLGTLVALLGGSMYSWAQIGEMIVLPPLFVGFLIWISLRQVRGARTLEGTRTYEFSDADIRLRGTGFDTRVQWAMITVCYGPKEGLLFKSGNASMVAVPGRPLSSDGWTELRRLIVDKGIKLEGPGLL